MLAGRHLTEPPYLLPVWWRSLTSRGSNGWGGHLRGGGSDFGMPTCQTRRNGALFYLPGHDNERESYLKLQAHDPVVLSSLGKPQCDFLESVGVR